MMTRPETAQDRRRRCPLPESARGSVHAPAACSVGNTHTETWALPW